MKKFHEVMENQSYELTGKNTQHQCFCGCLSQDTLITLADGTSKRIDEIMVGERVICEENRIGTVSEIVTGYADENLICIETENGCRLRCTGDHPVATEYKYIKASQVKDDMTLIGINGHPIWIKAVYPVPGSKVYNLIIETQEGEGSFFAQGVLVGDYVMENKLNGKNRNGENELSQEQQDLLKMLSSML